MIIEEVQLIVAENAELKAHNAQLLERVARLETQLAQNSHNSSKPPSADGFKRPAKKQSQSTRKTTDRNPGGQPGHPGNSLVWNEQPDHIIYLRRLARFK